MNLPDELINKIIMMNRPQYPYFKELNSSFEYCESINEKLINRLGQRKSFFRGLRWLRFSRHVMDELEHLIHSYEHEGHPQYIDVTDSEDDEFYKEIEYDPYLDPDQIWPHFEDFALEYKYLTGRVSYPVKGIEWRGLRRDLL